MTAPITRRSALQAIGATALLPLVAGQTEAGPLHNHRLHKQGWIAGTLTGAQAAVAALQQQGCGCVFGIPGAQENELWDTFKSMGQPYLLAAHEFAAACMADGYARATGRPGVLCVVPGPGITNSLTGLGEALLDSIPIVALVGDVGNGSHARPFQVHSLPNADLLRPVCKEVFVARCVAEIPLLLQQAFACAQSGEPGPVAVVVPYNLLIETHDFHVPPPPAPSTPWDEPAVQRALALLRCGKFRVGIYAGLGCMDSASELVQVAELLQAPVATSISGKGVIPECHPLAVGWGYGPQGTIAAEEAFKHVDLILAIGVRFSEVATGYYSNPQPRHLIHVDANPQNLGRVLKPDVCVAADAGAFLQQILAQPDTVRRSADAQLCSRIQHGKAKDCEHHQRIYAECGVDPMAFVLALRKHMPDDGLLYVDVTVSEHLAAEAYCVKQPRTYFNPADNQAMGWSIPAAIGGQRARCERTVATLTGDGCLLMSAMEISTAAREGLPVKFFVLDDHAYHYMQRLQQAAYKRTTATHIACIDYRALAQALGVGYAEIPTTAALGTLAEVLCHPGPLLCRVAVDYRNPRPIRWLEAVKKRYTKELTIDQKARFVARLGTRAVTIRKQND